MPRVAGSRAASLYSLAHSTLSTALMHPVSVDFAAEHGQRNLFLWPCSASRYAALLQIPLRSHAYMDTLARCPRWRKAIWALPCAVTIPERPWPGVRWLLPALET